jgi:succinate-acetate transporter protein
LDVTEKIANPAALGLACFALTTFLLSVLDAGLASKELLGLVVSCALIYGGTVQIIAGVLDTRVGSTFGGTAFSSYGGFWICLGLAFLLEFLGVWVLTQDAIGIFLLAWTLFTFYMWMGSFRLNWALASTFTLLLVTFILLDIGHLANMPTANVAGGYVGIICALNAWYVSAAIILNELFEKEVLPLGHIKS